MIKKNIAIVTGGDSSEEVISVQSATLINESINKTKYNTFLVYVRLGEWSVETSKGNKIPIDKNDFSFSEKGVKVTFDCAYLIIHGPPAENGKLQAYFDLIKIPYVGPKVLQSSITFNKEICKQYLSLIDVVSSKAILVKDSDNIDYERIKNEINYPCFVKPNEAGSSFGVTKVYEASQLEKALEEALKEDNSVMIEKFIQGTEVTCGVYRLNDKIEVLPVTEIVSTKDFFDYEAKYTPGAAEEITPARISSERSKECQRLTEVIYKHLDLTGISRVDYIICDDEFILLEVNTIPGMSSGSIIPKQLKSASIDIKEVITGLVDEAIS